MIDFKDGQTLIANQLVLLQQGLLQSNSPTPLILTGVGTQLTVSDTASINNLVSGGNISATTLTLSGTSSVPTAPNADNSQRIANTAWVNAAISAGVASGGTFVASSVAITGGTINGTAIGLTNPQSAAFTSLTAATMPPNDNSTHVATTAYVVGQAGTLTPIMAGTATVGTSLLYARQDHVHPADTTRAPLASPAFTGTPTAPTASAGTLTTQVATCAYVQNAVATSGSYNSTSVAITGGTIDNTVIGGSTAAAASFSSLTMSGSTKRAIRIFTTATSSMTTTATDDIVIINKSAGSATTVNVYASPSLGQSLTVKDGRGDAGTNNITVTPFASNIDGASTFVINVNYGSIDIVWNGTNWSLL